LFEISTVIVAAEPVTFEAIKALILLTVPAAGVSPVSAVVPSYVHAVDTVIAEGATYAVCPRIVPTFTKFGFAMFASYRLNII
jgi:hypothetical protein